MAAEAAAKGEDISKYPIYVKSDFNTLMGPQVRRRNSTMSATDYQVSQRSNIEDQEILTD